MPGPQMTTPLTPSRQLGPGGWRVSPAPFFFFRFFPQSRSGLFPLSLFFVDILPVFLDHVFHPNLREAQFITEVYHVDGNAKEQGVVFCEMSGCENTEAELMDNNLKELLYKGTGYSLSYGGKMADIAKLSNQEIKDYHKKFYFPANTTVILSGMLEPERVLPLIATANLAPKQKDAEYAKPWGSIKTEPFREHVSKTVDFPSDDNEVGSASFAWRSAPSFSIEDLPQLLDFFFSHPTVFLLSFAF